MYYAVVIHLNIYIQVQEGENRFLQIKFHKMIFL